MRWIKKGLIYCPTNSGSWMHNSALTPTAFQYDENTVRVYAGFRDPKGISRIGYVDLCSNNPTEVKSVSSKPVLDIGKEGMFDDNGVILGDVIRVGQEVWLYYVGFQLVDKVKFLAFSGLAISEDDGNSFIRTRQTPIMDRVDEALYIRAIHSVIYDKGIFKIWYATGNEWQKISNQYYPCYDINYIESSDGKSFSANGRKVLTCNENNFEYRIGRPRVYMFNNKFIMNFTYGTTDGRYMTGQATSTNGIDWIRNDNEFPLDLSETGWDSRHLSYPSFITTLNGKSYIFYNGNDMGVAGFGYAELEKIGL